MEWYAMARLNDSRPREPRPQRLKPFGAVVPEQRTTSLKIRYTCQSGWSEHYADPVLLLLDLIGIDNGAASDKDAFADG